MNNSTFTQNLDKISSKEADRPKVERPRNLTMLKLQWLAERVRKVERIKKEISEGSYAVDSNKVALALLGIEEIK